MEMLIICSNVFLFLKHGNRISVFLFDNKIRQKHLLDFLTTECKQLFEKKNAPKTNKQLQK